MTAGAGLTGKDLYPRFSDEEYARRYRAVRNTMQKENLDAILNSGARGSSEVHYLSNYLAQSPCWLLFPRRGNPTVFIHFLITNPAPRHSRSLKTCAGTVQRPCRQSQKRFASAGLVTAKSGS